MSKNSVPIRDRGVLEIFEAIRSKEVTNWVVGDDGKLVIVGNELSHRYRFNYIEQRFESVSWGSGLMEAIPFGSEEEARAYIQSQFDKVMKGIFDIGDELDHETFYNFLPHEWIKPNRSYLQLKLMYRQKKHREQHERLKRAQSQVDKARAELEAYDGE